MVGDMRGGVLIGALIILRRATARCESARTTAIQAGRNSPEERSQGTGHLANLPERVVEWQSVASDLPNLAKLLELDGEFKGRVGREMGRNSHDAESWVLYLSRSRMSLEFRASFRV